MRMMILMTLVLLGVTSCGYELRGTTQKSNAIALQTPTVLSFDDARMAYDMSQTLADKLELLGIKTTTKPSDVLSGADMQAVEPPHAISVSNVNLRRYELVGVLTEVRLVLSADVSYRLYGQEIRTQNVQAERSYQYNEAGVATIDQQAAAVQAWLYQTLAERISEQYYALSRANRPAVAD